MKDIDIQLENGPLTVKGERKFEKEEKNKGFHRMERSYGSFVRFSPSRIRWMRSMLRRGTKPVF